MLEFLSGKGLLFMGWDRIEPGMEVPVLLNEKTTELFKAQDAYGAVLSKNNCRETYSVYPYTLYRCLRE